MSSKLCWVTELTHIANRDALVMSVVGMPGSIMLRASGGGADGMLWRHYRDASQIGTAILSRYRELAADAGSAAITGRPSALASALPRCPTRSRRCQRRTCELPPHSMRSTSSRRRATAGGDGLAAHCWSASQRPTRRFKPVSMCYSNSNACSTPATPDPSPESSCAMHRSRPPQGRLTARACSFARAIHKRSCGLALVLRASAG